MPGYKPLPASLTGSAADHVREAEHQRLDGAPAAAAILLEEALEASARTRAEMPGWLCGRLAALYRTLGRYDDEVLLLERYRDSQRTEEARTRYDARLSKARSIAERKRRRDSGALQSIRKSLARPARASRTSQPVSAPADLAGEVQSALRDAIRRDEGSIANPDGRLASLLTRLVSDARASAIPLEVLVSELRAAFTDVERTSTLIEDAYAGALVQLLALYFDERS